MRSGAPVELAVDQDSRSQRPEAPLSGQSAITRAVTVAGGRFAPGHLGELTQLVPFEMVDEALSVAATVGYPVIIRPSFILGGGGTGFAHDVDEMRGVARRGLAASPVSEILIERSVIGWKEYELEVMRDHADNCVVICSIENVDAMGVHTGDSITVAPAMTLSDPEYQRMRDAAFAVLRRIGVETGGSNVQFAVDPKTGRQVVIEMNPRVSRSSALASKATGFPIAKIAAKLALGYHLDEIPNDITRLTPASFEPTIDYVVVKVPRFAFEKFPTAKPVLGPQMKSVGEVMAIGRTFKEALQKAVRSLEQDRWALTLGGALDEEALRALLRVPNPDRLFAVGDAYRAGLDTAEIAALTRIDPWFLENIRELVAVDEAAIHRAMRHLLYQAKLAAEPGAAVGVAALLEEAVMLPPGGDVVVVITGGNLGREELETFL